MDFQLLAEPRRRAIFQTLATRPSQDLTVDEVAAVHGLHRSVAFTHLERLAAASLLVRGARPGPRGRPARTYRYAGTAAEASHPPRRHRLLAEILASALVEEGAEVMGKTRARSRAVGRGLAAGAATPARAVESLAAIGGEHELQGMFVSARNCVFREACDGAREVVCGVQAGIIEGALEATGTTTAVVPLGPDDSGGCSFRLVAPAR